MKLTHFLLVLSFTLWPCAAGAQKTHPDQAFFGLSKVHTIHLRIDAEAWRLMQPQRRAEMMRLTEGRVPPIQQAKQSPPEALEAVFRRARSDKADVEGQPLEPNSWGFEYAYVKADFEAGETTLRDVGLRFKGNSSFAIGGTLKRPFKLDLNRFVKGQKYLGVDSINLSNNAYDPSQLREVLCYQMYRDAGVPAPRTAFALVYLSVEGVCERRYLGLYTMVEEVDDKRFLKSSFGSARGMLVKPELMRGMPHMGNRPEPYAERYEIKTPDADPELFQRVIDFVRLPHQADDAAFARELEKRLDVDNFLRYLAVTVLVANTDSLLTTGHNYYMHVHSKDQKVRFIPWDNNLAMANFPTTGSVEQRINLSINRPWAGQFRLLERILAIPAYREAYHRHLRRMIEESFNPRKVETYLARLQPVLEQSRSAAGGKPIEGEPASVQMGGRGSGPPEIDEFVAKRVASVLAQLDQGAAGHTPPEVGSMPSIWQDSRTRDALGSCNLLAFVLLHHADLDGDFRLGIAEIERAIGEVYTAAAKASPAEGLDASALALALDPVLAPHLNDGKPFLASADAAAAAKSPPAMWAKAVCAVADADSSGKADRAELSAAAQRLLCACDRDQDGLLDERELVELLDELGAAAL